MRSFPICALLAKLYVRQRVRKSPSMARSRGGSGVSAATIVTKVGQQPKAAVRSRRARPARTPPERPGLRRLDCSLPVVPVKGAAGDEAKQRDWAVISMKNDWRSAARRSWKESDDDEPVSSDFDRRGHDGGRQCCAGAAERLPSQHRAGSVRVRREAERRGESDLANAALGASRRRERSGERVSVLRTAGLLLERQSLHFGHDRLRNLQHAHGWRLHDQGHSEPLVVTSSRTETRHRGWRPMRQGELSYNETSRKGSNSFSRDCPCCRLARISGPGGG